MSEKIIQLIPLDGHYTRSIALDRDLVDVQALERYLITPNGLTALRQIATSVAAGHAQRAWKIVGPYGSGKSAFGVLLAQLFSGPTRFPNAAKSLAAVSPKIANLVASANRFPIAVVGSRVSFGAALVSAVSAALEQLGKSRTTQKIRKQIDIVGGTYGGLPLNAAIGELTSDLTEAAISAGYGGVLFMIDEIGKFVEHAALYPQHGDLIALQQIAELACKGGDDRLVVIAMLHQHFASYAAGVGRALSDEWHKVAARFEEIPFDEPVERYAHFASQAFGSGRAVARYKEVVDSARFEYAKAIAANVLRTPTATDKKLFERSENLFPLHPLTLAALATISKRYGQSERSFHAFLMGGEAFALRDFAERTDVSKSAWYRVHDLYDYLSHGSELRFRELDAERRWVFARSAIEQNSQDSLGSALLKAIAIFELVKGNFGIVTSADSLAWAVGETRLSAVKDALAKFAENGVLMKTRKQTEYAFAVSTAVNVEALYEKAARADESELMVSGTMRALSQKFVVANRHYDETGTLRTIATLVGTPELWPATPDTKSDDLMSDAWLKLVLITEGPEQQEKCEQHFANQDDALSLYGCVALSGEARAALSEYSIWTSISREVNAKSLDPWTSRYVESRVQESSNSVERLVTSALTPTAGRDGPVFWHQGSPVPDSQTMNASQLGSWLFDKVYDKAPRIVNELINKDRPTSAIVLARQRLFDVLLGGDSTRRIYGDTEYPPERLIHSTLLKQSGIWLEKDGHWILQEPVAIDSKDDISAVWNAITRSLDQAEPQTFAKVLEALAAPPFGVRAGPAGIWIALYLVINRGKCAIFERGSLVLELTAEHLQRMYKNPQTFTLRELAEEDGSKKLLSDYREVLAAIGCQTSANPTFLEMTRILYRWFGKLPDFTARTTKVSKDAALIRSVLGKSTDPIALLTQTLKRAFVDSKSKLEFKAWLTAALTDLGMAHRRLQDEVAAELSKGFGIAGPLGRIRSQLQNECTREASRLADANLKSFILRCTDVVLTDEKWLDSVGSLIAHRQLDSWEDDTLSKFQEQLTELCGRYRRWMQVVMQRGAAPRAAERFVGLTLTMPGGEEASVFVTRNDESDSIAKDVLALITESAKGNHEVAAAALAQALLELQAQLSVTKEKEASNG